LGATPVEHHGEDKGHISDQPAEPVGAGSKV
jgi:hypothetical protein